MKIAVLGTGMVGQSLAGGLSRSGHDVVIGTRDPDVTRARREPDAMGAPGFGIWYESHDHIPVVRSDEAVAGADLIVNATNGVNSIAALEQAGAGALDGSIVLDVANALDFSTSPPSLAPTPAASLAESIQAHFPAARVVKALNTMNANVMVEPGLVGDGEHTVFLCGDDDSARHVVRSVLEDLGWHDILDLGDLSAASTVEALLPLWLRLMGATGSPLLQFQIVR